MSPIENVDGTRKAALLLISLGTETAARIMKLLTENQVQKISYEIANIDFVDEKDRDLVIDEFITMSVARGHVIDGGMNYASNLLYEAFGAQKAKEVMGVLNQIQLRKRPFDIARKADPQQLTNILLEEASQTVALILCYMPADKAAEILANFPENRQAEIAERIGTISSTSPVIIEKIEKVIENKFSNFIENDAENVGGVSTLVDILNAVGRSTEKNIISDLEKSQPALSEEVKANLITFDDIISLEKSDVQKVLREVNHDVLVMALKGASETIREFIYSNQSSRSVEMLKEDLQFLGPARLSAVEEAQQNIVAVIRRLDEQGDIYIGRGEQDAVIS